MPAWVAPAIGAAASVLGSVFGGAGSNRSARDARRWQEKMWNKENAYNAPLQQRLRMVEGGFNPALMYGGGSVMNTSAKSPGAVEVPQVNIPGAVSEGVEAFVRYALMDKQMQLIEASTNQKHQAVSESLTNQRFTEGKIGKLSYEIGDLVARTERNMFDVEKGRELLPSQKDLQEKKAIGEGLRNIMLQIDATNHPQKVKLELAKAVADVDNAVLTGERKEIDIAIAKCLQKWYENGVSPSDPLWQRSIPAVLENARGKLSGLRKYLPDGVDAWLSKFYSKF